MDNNYFAKYLKYKHKYEMLKKQTGGTIIYTHETNTNKMIKRDAKKNLFYELYSSAGIFDDEQRFAIDDMINFVFPFLEKKANYIDPNITNNIEVINAGSFGIVVGIPELAIKIIKINHSEKLINEIGTLLTMNKSQLPNQINKFYGYITTNDAIGTALNKYDQHITNRESLFMHLGLHTNLSGSTEISISPLNVLMRLKTVIDIPIKHESIVYQDSTYKEETTGSVVIKETQKGGNPTKLNTSESLIFLLFERGLEDSYTFFRGREPEFNEVNKFMNDMIIGISFIHKMNKIHNDFKLENVVVKSKNPLLFQLIDFGEMIDFDYTMKSKQIEKLTGTLRYFKNSIFEKQRSFYYDWYCLYITLLELFNLISFNQQQVSNYYYPTKHTPALTYVTSTKLNYYHIFEYIEDQITKYINSYISILTKNNPSYIVDNTYYGNLKIYLINILSVLAAALYCENNGATDIFLSTNNTDKIIVHVDNVFTYEKLLSELVDKNIKQK